MEHNPFSHAEAETQASRGSSLFPFDFAWKQERMTSPWQIVPPIISTGQLPAVERNSIPVIKSIPEQVPIERDEAGPISDGLVRQYRRTSGWQRGVRPGLPPAGYVSLWDCWESQTSLPSSRKKWRAKKPLPQLIQQGYTGLIDSAVVQLASLFTVAFLTRHPFPAFLVGVVAAFVVGLTRTLLKFEKGARGSESALRRGIPGLLAFFFGMVQTLPFLLPNLQLALYTNALFITIQLIALAVISSTFLISS